MEPKLLYESPFTDMNPFEIDGVFGEDRAVQIIHILMDIRRSAA